MNYQEREFTTNCCGEILDGRSLVEIMDESFCVSNEEIADSEYQLVLVSSEEKDATSSLMEPSSFVMLMHEYERESEMITGTTTLNKIHSPPHTIMHSTKITISSYDDLQQRIETLKSLETVTVTDIRSLLDEDFVINWIIPLADQNLKRDYQSILLSNFREKDILFFLLFQICKEAKLPDTLSQSNLYKQQSFFSIILPLLKHLIFSQLDLIMISLSQHDSHHKMLCYNRLISVPEVVLKINHPSMPHIFSPSFVLLFLIHIISFS